MAGLVYTFVSKGTSPTNDGAITTSQGTVALGQSGLFLPGEYQAVIGEGLNLVAGPAQSPSSLLSAPTVGAGASGAPNGVYRCAVTFVTAAGETKIGPAASVTVTNDQIAWSAIPTAPASAGVLSRKLYRTVAGGGAGTEKLVTTLADDSTTTYTDNVADGSLGVTCPTSDTSAVIGGVSSINPQPDFALLTGNPADDAYVIGAGTGAKVSPSGSGSPGLPAALTGATAATRYVGGTTSGAPVSGTFAKGDFVIDQTAAAWVCTTAGSPGTWASLSGETGESLNLGSQGASVTLQAPTAYPMQYATLTANTAITLPAPVANTSLLLVLTQDSTGGRVPSLIGQPVNYPAGSPVYVTSPGAVNILEMRCWDGSNWEAFAITSAVTSLEASILKIDGATNSLASFRFVGVFSGAPATGTYLVYDVALDEAGNWWMCTAAGTPGTWARISGSGTFNGMPAPSDDGFLAQTVDPVTVSAYQVLTAGVQYVSRLRVDTAQPVSNLTMYVATAGATLTALENFASVFDVNGNLVAQTPDCSGATYSVTTTASSPVVTGAGFSQGMVGAQYTIAGVTGTFTVLSVQSSTSLTMSAAVPTSVSGATMTPTASFSWESTGVKKMTLVSPPVVGVQTIQPFTPTPGTFYWVGPYANGTTKPAFTKVGAGAAVLNIQTSFPYRFMFSTGTYTTAPPNPFVYATQASPQNVPLWAAFS